MKNLLNVAVIALGLAAGACIVAHHTPSATAAGYAAPAKVGETAPDFTLKDLDGKDVKLADFKGKIVVLEWFNPGCPFVVKNHKTFDTMRKTAADYKDKNVVWLAINSGAEGQQGAAKADNVKAKTDWKIEYPILLDTTGATGKAYGAKTTPHMYVIDKDGKLAYAGAIDNDRGAKKQGDKNYVKNAIDELIAGKKVTEATTEPYGCNVKYAK
ncbi:MAG TPA: thioredoxin family protein [Phycisphaerales bacterium]|nr:thioredoxin family protein [Phycisphaerales bacterium]